MINGLAPMSTAKVAKMRLLRGFPKDFQAWKNKFPREENKISSVGKFPFLRRKRRFLRCGSQESLFGGRLDRLGVRGFWRRGIGEERL